MIKRISLLVVAFTAVVSAHAQADVTSAYNANKAEEYDKAVTYIEKALTDPKATGKEKTWRYRGNIYLNVARSPKFAAQYPNATQLSKESFFKAIELDASNDYTNENKLALSELQGIVLEQAGKQYEAGDFCHAADNFTISNDISSKFAIVDSAAIFNTAYCYDRCGKTDLALAGYTQSAKIGYNIPSVYIYISDIYTREGKTEEARKVLTDARAKYPKDVELLRSEVNMLLGEQKYDQALEQLKSLSESDPNNETIWFVLGATYEKLGKVPEQEAAYKKATDIKPDYFDALFNLGATYYNQGVEKLKECDKIPPREQAKYDDCTASANVQFNKSIEYLERAYNQQPADKEIMSALMEAYVRVGNTEGQKKMKDGLSK